jgi:tRNA (guanine37-N1)-methyltransferase
LIGVSVTSVLDHVANHHQADDTPYGGGPGELLRVDVMAPLIKEALGLNKEIARDRKRVVLMDPGGQPFSQAHAERLSHFEELIFVCGRYEGVDARIHHYVDEAISLGDFVLSAGDIAAVAIFDACARLIDGVLGNSSSKLSESHQSGRLESSHYTRPLDFEGHVVPEVLRSGNHALIEKARALEAINKTHSLRPDLLQRYPLSDQERELLLRANASKYPWQKYE